MFLPHFYGLTKACSFEYSLFTSQLSKLFIAIKKNDNLIDNFTNDATNMASDGQLSLFNGC